MYGSMHKLYQSFRGSRPCAGMSFALMRRYCRIGPKSAPEGRWSGMHVGSLYQNAGLYCASAGLGNYVHASGVSALDGKLPLPDGWRVLIAQTVGLIQ